MTSHDFTRFQSQKQTQDDQSPLRRFPLHAPHRTSSGSSLRTTSTITTLTRDSTLPHALVSFWTCLAAPSLVRRSQTLHCQSPRTARLGSLGISQVGDSSVLNRCTTPPGHHALLSARGLKRAVCVKLTPTPSTFGVQGPGYGYLSLQPSGTGFRLRRRHRCLPIRILRPALPRLPSASFAPPALLFSTPPTV